MPTIFRVGGYRKPTPSLFGDGSDGDFYLAAGETHIETVTVPHQSVVEKNYKSLTIEAGALYRCSDCNAGLVIRVKGDCTIHGTIDQSGKAPKTNPNNNYPYPEELVCGDGGNGGKGGRYKSSTGSHYDTGGSGGTAMPARAYGGGYGAGGGGGCGSSNNDRYKGENGGSADTITVDVETEKIFVAESGQYGGGGDGFYTSNDGGNGNYGGGVALLYVGGALNIDGNVICDGLPGENGGDNETSSTGSGGGGGGGGGGGSVYIVHNGASTVTGMVSASGGLGGIGGNGRLSSSGESGGLDGDVGAPGANGAVTVKQYVKGMTA